ncbi:MAG: MerR family transcriptional regulator [Lentisphaeria bacterium]|nr:MerR family transcriptional regulator [Lentisphaeria bacterium]
MDNGKKLYSVSDLAASLNVPRTTVNDWLRKYDRYIDFEVRGRRKVYTDDSLAVLKIISAAKDGGTGSAELEAELASRCAVRPEISPLPEDGDPGAVSSGGEEVRHLPAVNFDVGNFLHDFEQRENWQARTRRRGFLIMAVLMILLLGAACATLLLLGQLLTLRESSRNLETRLAASGSETKLLREKAEKEFRAIAEKVEAAGRSEREASSGIEKRLEEQKARFETVLRRLEKTEKLQEREIVRLEKENFRLRAELDTAAKLLSTRQTALDRAESALAEARRKIAEQEKHLQKPDPSKSAPAKASPAGEKKNE